MMERRMFPSFKTLFYLQCYTAMPKTSGFKKSILYAQVSVFHPDWQIRSNFRFFRSDNLHKDSNQNLTKSKFKSFREKKTNSFPNICTCELIEIFLGYA